MPWHGRWPDSFGTKMEFTLLWEGGREEGSEGESERETERQRPRVKVDKLSAFTMYDVVNWEYKW